MKEGQGNVNIGTSGWVYGDWEGIFYPKDLRSRDKLKYFSSHFKTAEINYSFYHLPGSSTYQKWYSETPKYFVFAVKASRYITHIKRLNGIEEAGEVFIENALNLKEKLGPILFQFPPNFQASEENTKRLENLLKLTRKSLRYAFEFRHKSWCSEAVYKLLKKYNAAWVIADSPSYPKVKVITADFVYIRMHGPEIIFSSKYSNKELKNLARKIKKWLKKKIDVYCYFNNDVAGYAVENAKTLLKFCNKKC